MKLWGGRFTDEKNPEMIRFNSSFPIDRRFWKEDIQGSIAHVRMLGNCGILERDESLRIISCLREISAEIESGALPLEGEFEDIHSFVEAQLTERLGILGKKMHTARSRNDQVATDMKLYVKAAMPKMQERLGELRRELREKAEKSPFPMPGYTHMQRAQIVTFKYHLLAYDEMLKRDEERLKNALHIMDRCPLGSGALAGSSCGIDREQTARELGFAGIQRNTMDAVSDRDYILELLSDFSILMMHLSRLSEELILFSTEEFGFVRLSDAYSTGSSLMPQKKNPDSPELIRGKCARVYGSLMAMLTVMKGLPLCYNKDMQEDKSCFFESFDTVMDCLCIMSGVIRTMRLNEESMRGSISQGFLNATELADYLVGRGTAFRDAHRIVGEIVKFCETKNCEIQDLSLSELQEFSSSIQEDVFARIDPKSILYHGNKQEML